jgi:hypothetical protein
LTKAFQIILHAFFSNLIIGNPKNLVAIQGSIFFKWHLKPIFDRHPTILENWMVIEISWLPTN